ncbi:MAG: hypothetical protein Q8N08_07480 [Methanobacteriaceae archaeon]|nr:hypothetical protein [Methanobacteriaceae archaeon]
MKLIENIKSNEKYKELIKILRREYYSNSAYGFYRLFQTFALLTSFILVLAYIMIISGAIKTGYMTVEIHSEYLDNFDKINEGLTKYLILLYMLLATTISFLILTIIFIYYDIEYEKTLRRYKIDKIR